MKKTKQPKQTKKVRVTKLSAKALSHLTGGVSSPHLPPK